MSTPPTDDENEEKMDHSENEETTKANLEKKLRKGN